MKIEIITSVVDGLMSDDPVIKIDGKIIKESEMDAVRTEIVAIAMMNFGIKQYRIQEGYSDATLYGL